MLCSDCGYMLSAFDTKCRRCHLMLSSGHAKICPDCKKITLKASSSCQQCGYEFFPVLLPVLAPTTPATNEAIAQRYSGINSAQSEPANGRNCDYCGQQFFKTLRFCTNCGEPTPCDPSLPTRDQTDPVERVQQYQPAPVSQAIVQHSSYNPGTPVVVNVNVTQSAGNNGMWAVIAILFFGTPLGCVGLFMLGAIGSMFVGFCIQAAPTIVAGIASIIVSRLSMVMERKVWLISGIMAGGLIINALYLYLVHMTATY